MALAVHPLVSLNLNLNPLNTYIMDKLTFLAFMLWAIDRNLLECPVPQAWELFQKDSIRCRMTYTDPTNEFLYSESAAKMNPIDFFTEHILTYAKCSVASGVWTYGKYDERIMKVEARVS